MGVLSLFFKHTLTHNTPIPFQHSAPALCDLGPPLAQHAVQFGEAHVVAGGEPELQVKQRCRAATRGSVISSNCEVGGRGGGGSGFVGSPDFPVGYCVKANNLVAGKR